MRIENPLLALYKGYGVFQSREDFSDSLRGINKSSSDDRPGPGICDGGIEILTRHYQMPGRSWRAGESCGDGEPEGRDRPLKRESGGLIVEHGASVFGTVPMKNKTEGGKSSLGQPCCRALYVFLFSQLSLYSQKI